MKKSRPNDWRNSSDLSGVLWAFLGLVCIGLAFCLVGCPKQQQTKVPSYEEARVQATKEAPFVQEPVEQRSKLQGCDDKPAVLKQNVGSGVPYTGLLITNNKAACLVAQRAERDRLRRELSAERLRARTKQIVNDAAYKRLAEAARRSWWDRHKLSVLAPVLVTVGGALVIAVMYALTGGKPINVSTNAHAGAAP